ncbi:MAG: branched-chain amino acid transaminase [Patescibacteria group bacterium]|nr:branched-chain amino acid transaminase [Patescibacteria group bacterium]
MFDKNLVVYLDGEYIKLKDANISPMTHGLHYGTGVFEGIRAYKIKGGTGIFRLREHIERLFYSAEKLGLEIEETVEEIEEICTKLMQKNELESAYIRPLVFFDDASLGMKIGVNGTCIFITAFHWPKYLASEVNVKISPFVRISEKSTVCDAKISGHYINSFLASANAKSEGFDEPLLLDHAGAIAEGSVANIFFIKDKRLVTPQKGKILAGITRQSVIELALDLNYEIEEIEILSEDIKKFEGAFFTGTASEITPIKKIVLQDNQEVLFNIESVKELKNIFSDTISENSTDEKNWFTMIQ